MNHETIRSDEQLAGLCDELGRANQIAFDTEFVSEDTYVPELCLVQVATDTGVLAVIDPFPISDLRPFWQALADGQHQTIVHSGREELLFSLRAIEEPPHQLFDIQLAAGFVGYDYPAGYGSLISKLLGERLPKGETRTDWRRRPLSKRQLAYALTDVEHLSQARNQLAEQLAATGRAGWMEEEMAAWQRDVTDSLGRRNWRRLPRLSSLAAQGQAIARELWTWREQEAARRNLPPRRVLRDDLIVEIAKRGHADSAQIMAIRGMERCSARRSVDALSAAVQQGLSVPAKKLPRTRRQPLPAQIQLLAQILGAALTCRCHELRIAPNLVGTASDVRDLIAEHLGVSSPETDAQSRLTQGWRAQLVGKSLDELLTGKMSIRIRDPQSSDPLEFR